MSNAYISSAGSGSGTGDIDDPYLTIAEVNGKTFNADETVFFNRGDTFNDTALTCDQLVAANYDAYGSGSNPIIDGDATQKGVIISKNDVAFQNINVQNAGGAATMAIQITNGVSGAVTIDSCTITGNTGDIASAACIYSQATGSGHVFSNLTINQPHHTTGSGYGIFLWGASASPTLSSITLNGVTSLTCRHAIYFLSVTGTVSMSDITITDWNCVTAATNEIVYIRGVNVASTNLTLSGSDGRLHIREGASNITVTLDSLTVTDPFTGNDSLWITASQTVAVTNSTFTNGGISSAGALTLTDCTVEGTVARVQASAGTSTITGLTSISPTTEGVLNSGTGVTTITDSTITNPVGRGLSCTGGTMNATNVTVTGGTIDGAYQEGAGVMNLTLCTTSSNGKDGVSANGTGSVTCEGCTANSNGSAGEATGGDGFTSHDSVTLNVRGCVAAKNWKSGIAVTGTSSGDIINNTSYDNYDATVAGNYGIWVNSTGTWTIKNNITENNEHEIYVSATAVAGATLAIDNNTYNDTRGGDAFHWNGTDYNWADWLTNSSQDASSTNEDPLFNDKTNLDFTLPSTSPCVGTAAASLTDNFVGTDGEPFANWGRDKGGIQNKHNAFHPTNL